MVLKQVGRILSESMRSVFDVAGRYGGEEFCLILDETDSDKAFQIIERVRRKIAQTRFQRTDKNGRVLENDFLKLTMSFGIALLDKDSDIKNETDWIARADEALYLSKQGGRNRTTLYK